MAIKLTKEELIEILLNAAERKRNLTKNDNILSNIIDNTTKKIK